MSEASDKCACEASSVVVVTCSGASNCGQIANAAAVELDRSGIARFMCLAGFGGHVSGMIESARSADRLLVIDGCPVACGRKAVEHVGLTVTDYVDVTELGIEKRHEYDYAPALVDQAIGRARSLLSEPEFTAGRG